MTNLVQKKGSLFLAMAVLVLIGLSACASGTPSVTQSGDAVVNGSNTTGSVTGTVDIAPGTVTDGAQSNEASTTGSVEIAPGKEAGTSEVSEEVQNLLANQDKLNVIVAKGDVAGCKELDMPQFQVSCETNVLANKAKSKKDLAVCDSASTVDIKTRCAEVVANKVF